MVTPYSYESSFCSGFEGTRESLERIAGTLLTATDCIARDEHALTREKEDFLVVIPVIITTAKLFIHVMKKNSVALDSGILHGDNVPVQEVPFIRFRKSMTTKLTDEFTVSDFDAACDNRVRSILVVNSNHLEEVFCSWRLSKGFGAVYPWERLRKLPVEVRFLG
ncbi:MAG: hypothetical protein ACKVRP_02495 [Bacteroidota bacterium]